MSETKKTIPDSIKRYIDNQIRLEFKQNEPPEIKFPKHGSNSELYFLFFGSTTKLILRCFKEKKEFKKYYSVMNYFSGKMLPIPDLIDHDGDLLTKLIYKRYFCIEEFIDGKLLIDTQIDEDIENLLLSSLAAMHNYTSDKWGEIGSLKQKGHREKLLERVNKKLSEIPEGNEFVKIGEKDNWKQWFEQKWQNVPKITKYSLIHRHLAPDDIMISDGNTKAVFLDNISLQFGHFAYDLEDVLEFTAGDSEEKRQVVISKYMSLQNHVSKEFDYKKIEPFFRADYHLKKLRTGIKKYNKTPEKYHQLVAYHSNMLRNLVK